MACTWRIRHKLMLGMTLVVSIMALLLGGTLYGLATYRYAMGTCESKLDEYNLAAQVKEAVRELTKPAESSQQALHIRDVIPKIKIALVKYEETLNDTISRGRSAGVDAKRYVEVLKRDLQKLQVDLRIAQSKGVALGGTYDLFDPESDVSKDIARLDTVASDLIDCIQKELATPIETTRKELQKSIWLLVITGILAVLVMTGLLRFFYGAVARPIRELEEGVSRVAKGDFHQRIEIHSGDEIEDLAHAYNEMTDKLGAMYDNLAQQVNERSRQLVRSERLAGIGFLAAGVAHEINNPLASIAFCSESLESRLSESLLTIEMKPHERETIAKYLKMIQEEAFRCKEITQKLLAFSRGGELKREATDLVEIIQGVLDVVQHLQNCKGKHVDFRPAGPIVAWVNAQEVKQVFLNLVINALESMDEGGTLTITHSVHDGQIDLIFKDTGCGMTPDVLENIFEPFFTRSRTGKGTGLGLSISHRIITQHGGEIEASSDGPNRGSTFKVRLPIQPTAEAANPGQDVQDPVEEFLKLSTAKRNSRAA